jgi:FkbM family methyltransferase
LRRVIWRLHWERFQRLRRRQAKKRRQAPAVVRFLNQELELHPSLAGVSEELLLFGTHEPLATSFYLDHLSPGDHVLDVGSNIGYWLLSAKSRVGKDGRVLGFEPVARVREILLRNIQRSGQNGIEVFPCAIGASSGTAHFYESQVPNWGSLVRDANLLQTRSTTVQVRRLDDILQDLPGFCPKVLRMDVEGAELMVLEGATEILRKYKPCLFIEFHTSILGWGAVRNSLIGLCNLGYSSGVLIERTWDHPWMSKRMRERRCWSGTIDTLLRRVESPKNRLTEETLSLILRRPWVPS